MAPFGVSTARAPRLRAGLLLVACAGVACALALASVAPPERTLGSVYRLVLFHGGLAMVAVGMLVLSGLAGLVSLVRPSPASEAATAAGLETAALTFAVYFASAMIAMQQAWGGIGWREPRFLGAVGVLFAGGAAFLTALIVDSPRARSLAAIFTGVVGAFLLTAVPLSFHPAAPVTGSGAAPGVSAYFYGIVASLAVAVLALWARGALGRHHPSYS